METMRERFCRIASDLLDTDPRLAVVLADISADAFGPAQRRHPDRVINLGIREQLVISVSGGLALSGMRMLPREATVNEGNITASLREQPGVLELLKAAQAKYDAGADSYEALGLPPGTL